MEETTVVFKLSIINQLKARLQPNPGFVPFPLVLVSVPQKRSFCFHLSRKTLGTPTHTLSLSLSLSHTHTHRHIHTAFCIINRLFVCVCERERERERVCVCANR